MVKRDGRGLLAFCYIMILIVSISVVLPFLNIISIAFSSYESSIKNPMMIFPKDLDFTAFRLILENSILMKSYENTIIVTIIGTLLGVALTVATAYPLSRKRFRGKKLVMNMIIFTMIFNGGLIPNFYLIRGLGLLDSLWALIIPGALTAYNIILTKSFFEGIPEELEEAARIDGATDFDVLTRVILPLSGPIVATITLFSAVSHWNSFFNAVIYIRDSAKWTLQLVLREILLSANNQLLQSGGNAAEMASVPLKNINYATIVVVILPILCLYPFLQKYFVKGIMIGAVKG
ncbi:MAG: binding-protein-dependent transport system inner rane component [Paenibacillaceae bacterium]|jgi:putative aldouronate transport system permease protein|nr:binding-protein-dependent transport system inner rane component [Paenibacillaceae bacterium]